MTLLIQDRVVLIIIEPKQTIARDRMLRGYLDLRREIDKAGMVPRHGDQEQVARPVRKEEW
ncbi:MAG: hypothetical protein HY232_03475 [Acidobacteria bacterium]|nr:hypothetical protein [Acidobacteriota bacterium]